MNSLLGYKYILGINIIPDIRVISLEVTTCVDLDMSFDPLPSLSDKINLSLA